MSRDPNITVTERVIIAARRWAASDADEGFDPLDPKHRAEFFSRVGELRDAVCALEKHNGMRSLTFRVRPMHGGKRPKKRPLPSLPISDRDLMTKPAGTQGKTP